MKPPELASLEEALARISTVTGFDKAHTEALDETRFGVLLALDQSCLDFTKGYSSFCSRVGVIFDTDFLQNFLSRVRNAGLSVPIGFLLNPLLYLLYRLNSSDNYQEHLNLAFNRFINLVNTGNTSDEVDILLSFYAAYYIEFGAEAMGVFPIDDPALLINEVRAAEKFGTLRDSALLWYVGLSCRADDDHKVTMIEVFNPEDCEKINEDGTVAEHETLADSVEFLDLSYAFTTIFKKHSHGEAVVIMNAVSTHPWSNITATAAFFRAYDKIYAFFDKNPLEFFNSVNRHSLNGLEDVLAVYISEDQVSSDKYPLFCREMQKLSESVDVTTLSYLVYEDVPTKLLPLLATNNEAFVKMVGDIINLCSTPAPFEIGYERNSFRIGALLSVGGVEYVNTLLEATDAVAAEFPDEDDEEELSLLGGKTKRALYCHVAAAVNAIIKANPEIDIVELRLDLIPEVAAMLMHRNLTPTRENIIYYHAVLRSANDVSIVNAEQFREVRQAVESLQGNDWVRFVFDVYLDHTAYFVKALPEPDNSCYKFWVINNLIAYCRRSRMILRTIEDGDLSDNPEGKRKTLDFLKDLSISHLSLFDELSEAFPYMDRYRLFVDFLDANGLCGLWWAVITLDSDDFCLFLDAVEIENPGEGEVLQLKNQEELLAALNAYQWLQNTFYALEQCSMDSMEVSLKNLNAKTKQVAAEAERVLLTCTDEKITALGRNIIAKVKQIRGVFPLLRIMEMYSNIGVDVSDIRLMNEGTEHTRAMVMMGAFIILMDQKALEETQDGDRLFAPALIGKSGSEIIDAVDELTKTQDGLSERLREALKLASVKIEMERAEDSEKGPIGAKSHMLTAVDGRLVRFMENVFNLYSTPFHLVHAGKSLAHPPAQSGFELKITIVTAAIAGFFGEVTEQSGALGESDLQITASGEWSNEVCGIVGATVILASKRNVIYPEGSFAHNQPDKWRTRFMIRGAGNRVTDMPDDIDQDASVRTDVLARIDLGDIDIYNFMKKLANDYELDGPYKPLMEAYIKEFKYILTRHGLLDALGESSWVSEMQRNVKKSEREIESEEDVRKHEEMINKFTKAWVNAQDKPDLGVHGEIKKLLAKTYYKFNYLKSLRQPMHHLALAA